MGKNRHLGDPRGFTLTEIIVVIGILGVLASILLPELARSRRDSRLVQCTNNLRQLGQALMMYNIDHSSAIETYPGRLTWLTDLEYVRDERVYVCPMDYTHATVDPNSGRTALKPYYNSQIPANDYNYWAERNPPISGSDCLVTAAGTTAVTRNCSYIYEFNSRPLQAYTKTVDGTGAITAVSWTSPYGQTWATDVLVSFYSWDRDANDNVYLNNPANTVDDSTFIYDTDYAYGSGLPGDLVVPANPLDMDRDGDGIITWQEAKFWQMNNSDVYCTGYASSGDPHNINPAAWNSPDNPYDTIAADDTMMQRDYQRGLMPIVRCFWHCNPAYVDRQDVEDVLNLAIDGNTFFSAPYWEETAWKYGRVPCAINVE